MPDRIGNPAGEFMEGLLNWFNTPHPFTLYRCSLLMLLQQSQGCLCFNQHFTPTDIIFNFFPLIFKR